MTSPKIERPVTYSTSRFDSDAILYGNDGDAIGHIYDVEHAEDAARCINFHDKLVAALRPFAAVETYDNEDHETCALFFEAGDIRRAQALLREIEGGEEEG